MLIDGKEINQKIGEQLSSIIKTENLKPTLGILSVGDDPASKSFIKVKKSFGEKYGFVVNTLNLSEDSTLSEIKNSLLEMNINNSAVILQLPLPEKFRENTEEILNLIDKNKDVDNLGGGNFQAPIVLALEEIFKFLGNQKDFSNMKISEKKIGLIGLGQVVGLPIKKYLEENNFDLEIIKKGEEEKIKNCEIIISGVGKPYFIKKEYLKEGSVLIDYGCSFVRDESGTEKACGDFDPECFEISSFYTPVPGCMGPLVVASLFKNVLEAVTRIHNM